MTGPILLPSTPKLQIDSPSMINWGGPLTPPLGGAVQNLNRLGTRHALEFTLPQVRTEPHGRIWSARLRMGLLFGALLPFGQDGLKIGTPGAIVVDGAGQSGMILNVRGGTPNYAIREGQAFSHLRASTGMRYLYFASAQLILDAAGKGAVPIFPMLRVIPDDGDVLEFGQPMIQGSLSGTTFKWKRLSAPWSDLGTITISEDE